MSDTDRFLLVAFMSDLTQGSGGDDPAIPLLPWQLFADVPGVLLVNPSRCWGAISNLAAQSSCCCQSHFACSRLTQLIGNARPAQLPALPCGTYAAPPFRFVCNLAAVPSHVDADAAQQVPECSESLM